MKTKLSKSATLIVSLSHLIEEHDATDLIMTLCARYLKRTTGLHFDMHSGLLYGTCFHPMKRLNHKYPEHSWKYDLEGYTPSTLNTLVHGELEKTFGKSWQKDLEIFQATESLFTSNWFKKIKAGQYEASGNYASSLAYVLDYVVNNQMPDNYVRAHKAWETKHEWGGYQNKLATVGTHTSDMIPGISIKIFSNGRIDIKGLSDKQSQKLDDLGELTNRIKKTVQK